MTQFVTDWQVYKNFSKKEFACSHCLLAGKEISYMQIDFMDKLQLLRDSLKKPVVVTSGYRCPNHPVEKKKKTPGEHTFGAAADIACSGELAHEILYHAFIVGFTRIGVKQKGFGRFIHLGIGFDKHKQKTIWSY